MVNERQQQIIDLITLEGEVRITSLKEQFDVTEMTLRRDMEKLELQGIIRRTFGGAILVTKDIALHDRSIHQIEAKKRIGRKAASLVQAGQSIYLDGGSTTLQVVRYLKQDSSIHVITNALNVATECVDRHLPVMVIGGTVIEKTASMVGPLAVEAISKMAFDHVFLGATGVDASHGFSNSNMYEADLKKIAIQQAAQVNIVLDHSKFGVKSLFSFADFTKIDRVITDEKPSKEYTQLFDEREIVLEVCLE